MAELRPEYDAMGMDPGLYGDQLAYDANAMYSEAEVRSPLACWFQMIA
jgi:hypothetical protein